MVEQSNSASAAIRLAATSIFLGGPSQPAETPSLKIREAGEGDLPRLLELGYKFHQYSPYHNLSYKTEAVEPFILHLINSPDAILYMHGAGAIGGLLHPLYFGGGLIAQELFWFAEKGGMALLKAFESWATHKGAQGVSVSSLVVGDREDRIVDRLYTRRGYQAHEKAYFKEI